MVTRDKNRRAWILAGTLLLLVALACGPPEDATPTIAPQIAEASATPTLSPAANDTPSPQETEPGACTLDADFVTDVTIPDGTEIGPGESFVKTWRIENSGTCPWEPGTRLVFVSGDAMGGPASVPAGAAAPDATLDVSANLTAPADPGTYQGNWQLEDADGVRFGAVVVVQIVVPAQAATTQPSTPIPVCTPPACASGEVLYCPSTCIGGCNFQCVTPAPSPCVAIDPALSPIQAELQFAGLDIGCPTAASSSVQGALQQYWTNVTHPNPHMHSHDYMIWRSDTRQIYAMALHSEVSGKGSLYVYQDQWQEGMPDVQPSCASMSPPTSGYLLPVRGFGKVWCENQLWDTVGWPNASEEVADLLIQPTASGLLMRASGQVSGSSFLFAYHFTAGEWVVRPIGP